MSMSTLAVEAVPKPLRSVLRLSELRGPISITFACTFGLAIALIDQYYYPKSPIELEAKEVVSSILLVMDLGSAEKFYVSTVFRLMGMIAGIAFGVSIGMVPKLIWPSGLGKDEEWKIMTYRATIFGAVVLMAMLLMKRYPKYSFPFIIFAIKFPTGLLAKTVKDAISKILSDVAALFIAMLSIVVFERINTTALLTESNGKAISGVLRICELAIDSQEDEVEEFNARSEEVHKIVSQAEASISTYFQWRAMTCRSESRKDFSLIVKPLRPLFYEGYSLFWSNKQSYHCAEYKSEILFCDSFELYELHFRAPRDQLVEALRCIRNEFEVFLSKSYFTQEYSEEMLTRVIQTHLWDGIFVSQQFIRGAYMEHRTDCFSTFAQRWNVTHFMRQISVMSLALVEYVRALSMLFIKDEDKKALMGQHLDELAEALEELRSDEMGGLRGSSGIMDSPTNMAYSKAFARGATKGGL